MTALSLLWDTREKDEGESIYKRGKMSRFTTEQKGELKNHITV